MSELLTSLHPAALLQGGFNINTANMLIQRMCCKCWSPESPAGFSFHSAWKSSLWLCDMSVDVVSSMVFTSSPLQWNYKADLFFLQVESHRVHGVKLRVECRVMPRIKTLFSSFIKSISVCRLDKLHGNKSSDSSSQLLFFHMTNEMTKTHILHVRCTLNFKP